MSDKVMVTAIVGLTIIALAALAAHQVDHYLELRIDLEGRKIHTITKTEEEAQLFMQPKTVTVDTSEYKEQK
ncbi:hypothetical protein [Thiocapsa sp. N5-Cardenillas]|uniref:hypothetical protein n=1 Tax=Thiocapsa sp. N5-Cardenillas TaxID=3137397 RepID=UPI0035AE92F9